MKTINTLVLVLITLLNGNGAQAKPPQFVEVSNDERLLATAAKALDKVEQRYHKLGGTAKHIVVQRAYISPEEQYEIMQRRCGCDPIQALPQNVSIDDWMDKKLCRMRANECGIASFSVIWRENGRLRTKPLGHLGGFAVDVRPFGTNSTESCNKLTLEEKMSKDVPNIPGSSYTKDCIPREQQLVIRAMLENGFCVGLKSQGMREPWHFEHVATARAVGGNVSRFCTQDRADPNMQRLWFLHTPPPSR